MTNQLGDAPSARRDADEHARHVVQQLRFRYGAFDESTKEEPCTRVYRAVQDDRRETLAGWVWRKLRGK